MIFRKKLALIFFIGFCSVFPQNNQKPKNIIIMIGDGMGVNTVSASVLSDKNSPFFQFTTTGFSITKAIDRFITDSGAGGTAIATGYRTNYKQIGVDKTKTVVKTILERAEELNMSTGVVVTSSVTNATPASFMAHVPDRKMENEIADQILQNNFDVIVGAGTKYFFAESNGGDRDDEHDLTLKIKEKGYNYFNVSEQFLNSDPASGKVIALLGYDGIVPAPQRNFSLGQLTSKALDYLSKDKDGFILMVEGSQIDWGLHDNNTPYTLSELKDFATALTAALDFAKKDGNTLVLVTADHETGGMSINSGTIDGDSLSFEYTTKGHSAEMVGIFTYGPGEEHFKGIMDNFMIGRKLFHLIDPAYKFEDR